MDDGSLEPYKNPRLKYALHIEIKHSFIEPETYSKKNLVYNPIDRQ